MPFDATRTGGHRAKKPTYCSLCGTWQVSTYNHQQGKAHRRNAAPHTALLVAHREALRSLRQSQPPPSDQEPTMIPTPKTAAARPATASRVARPITVAAAPAAAPEKPPAPEPAPVPVVVAAEPKPEPAPVPVVVAAEPKPEPKPKPEPSAAPTIVEHIADGIALEWDPEYKTLAIDMPPSIISQIEKRLAKLGLSPAKQAEEVDAEIVRAAIEKACLAYENKRARARVAAAARRAAKKEATAIHKLDAEAATEPEAAQASA